MTPFTQAVYDAVKQIPKGQTRTYKEIAIKAGRPNAYRAVGNILNKSFDPTIPCHRVIKSSGALGGYNRGETTKKQKLIKEKAIHPQDHS